MLLFFIIVVNQIYSLSQEDDSGIELVNLYLGEIKTIPISNPKRVVINNPVVADVTSINKEEMLIIAKGTGTTNLVWWDERGQHALQLRVFAEDMNIIKQRVDAILKELNFPDVFTRSANNEGKVLLLGSVKTAQNRDKINLALGTLKEKIVDLLEVSEEEAVVEIEVEVLELDKDATKTLGFTMPASVTLSENEGRFKQTVGGGIDAIWHVFQWTRDEFTAKIDALVQEGKAKILSRPRLACQSGKEAELLVGGEKPILTTGVVSGGGESTEVQYKEYGIKLKIKPTVVEEKKIKLALNMEVSELGTIPETIGDPNAPSAKAYPLTKRNASTELSINDGQTMAVGGLIKQKTEEDVRKTAGLGDIPILGLFFRNKETKIGGGQGERGNTELYITLTPTIVGRDLAASMASPQSRKKKMASPGTYTMKESELTGGEEVTEPPGEIALAIQEPDLVVKNRYTQMITERIQESLVYPSLASKGQFGGSLRLGLCLHSSGQLLDIKINQSSGSAVLDENTLRTVKEIAPFSPFPPEIKDEELCVEIPIVYSLKQ